MPFYHLTEKEMELIKACVIDECNRTYPLKHADYNINQDTQKELNKLSWKVTDCLIKE